MHRASFIDFGFVPTRIYSTVLSLYIQYNYYAHKVSFRLLFVVSIFCRMADGPELLQDVHAVVYRLRKYLQY